MENIAPSVNAQEEDGEAALAARRMACWQDPSIATVCAKCWTTANPLAA
jgi:hypothetical protein